MNISDKDDPEIIEAAARAQADDIFGKFLKARAPNPLEIKTMWILWDKAFTYCGKGDCYSLCMAAIFRYGFLEGQRQTKERQKQKRPNRARQSISK